MDCTQAVYDENFYDLIVEVGELPFVSGLTDCLLEINSQYYVGYFNREGLPEFNIRNYNYIAIPNLYTTLDVMAMDASGILQIQNQPALSLKGQGVLVGIIDTGIDYRNPVFRFADGTSRIAAIWDQTVTKGPSPVGFFYGTEYRTDIINEALGTEEPLEVVPSVDENGHGTYVASLAAGSNVLQENFVGAAPFAQLAVVKMKEAKRFLRDYFFTPEDGPVFQENDIMAAVAYLDGLAFELNMPLALCISLGSNQGNHGGRGPLSNVLDTFCSKRFRAAVVAAGNEANKRHHYYGNIPPEAEYENVEINVGSNVPGFTMELWSPASEVYTVEIISPTGESTGRIGGNVNTWDSYFIFEDTSVTVDKNITFISNDYRLIFFRFAGPSQGIWKIRVYAENVFEGIYHIWLPMEELLSGNVTFLRSNPDTTITVPGNSRLPITVAGYNASNNSIFLDSGRGYTISGIVKPDLAAPAVDVVGADGRNLFVTRSGTSAAAAITAGATALILEWAVVRGNNSRITAGDIKSLLIQGADRDMNRLYPNREWGYGRLDLYQAFNTLRTI